MQIKIKVRVPNKEIIVCTNGGRMKEALHGVKIALRKIDSLQHQEKVNFFYDEKTNTISGEEVNKSLVDLALEISRENALLWGNPTIII